MRDERERSGEESTMPAPESVEKRDSCTPRPINVNTPPGKKGNPFPEKAPSMRREGVTVFSRD